MNRKLHPEVKNAFLIIAGLLCSSAAYNLYLIPNNIAALPELVSWLTILRISASAP